MIYLKNATYIDWETLDFKSGHLKISEGSGGGLEFVDSCPNDAMDCTGKLVTKAFACGHHHVYSTLSRGMPPPAQNPTNFYEILKFVWWHLDKCLDRDMIEASALACAMYCAKNGVTFVIDHHASPVAVNGSLETIAEAFDRVGVSHLLCYELSDRDGPESREAGLQETESYLQNRPGLVGLHASFTVGEELLKKAVQLAGHYDSGLHIHVAEDRYDEDACIQQYGCRVIQRLQQAGGLDFSKSILAHCLHLHESERELLSHSPVYVVQNMESNLNNEVGTFCSTGLVKDRIFLGTDGMHSDMIRSAQWTYFNGKSTDGLDLLATYQRLRNVHRYLSQNQFKGDGNNNLVILNDDSPTPVTAHNFLGHFFFGLNAGHVDSVISSGRLIVHQRQLTTVDESEVLAFARKQAMRLWEKL